MNGRIKEVVTYLGGCTLYTGVIGVASSYGVQKFCNFLSTSKYSKFVLPEQGFDLLQKGVSNRNTIGVLCGSACLLLMFSMVSRSILNGKGDKVIPEDTKKIVFGMQYLALATNVCTAALLAYGAYRGEGTKDLAIKMTGAVIANYLSMSACASATKEK